MKTDLAGQRLGLRTGILVILVVTPGVFQVYNIISILLLGFGGRDNQGRFLRKTIGTPKQLEIREKDILRKPLNKPLYTLKNG